MKVIKSPKLIETTTKTTTKKTNPTQMIDFHRVCKFFSGSGGSRTLVQTLGNNAFYILSLLLNCRVEAGQRQPTTTVSFGVSPKLKGVVCGYSCVFGVQAASYKKKPTAGQMVLIPGIRQPLHRSILRLQKLNVRINVSYKQHTVCLHCFLGAVKTGRTHCSVCKGTMFSILLWCVMFFLAFQMRNLGLNYDSDSRK